MSNLERELCRKIYEEFKDRLHWYVQKRFYWMNSEDLFDIEQDTWRKLMENIDVVGLLEPPEQLNWLVEVCHNQAVSLLRKYGRIVDKDSEIMEQLLDAKNIISVEDEVIDKIMLEELMKNLSKEDRKILYRNAFSLKNEKRSNAEICKVYRIKQKLRKMWKDNDWNA